MIFLYKIKSELIKFLLVIILFISSVYAFADAPKNYLKGIFQGSVKNYFLVATEEIRDGKFKKSIIVMFESDEFGAWGLVINKPIGNVPLNSLINETENSELNNKRIDIFWGGPVETDTVFILHSNEYKSKSTKEFQELSISRDYKTLIDIAKNQGPKKSLVILGYSGWGDGQLEGEIERGHWNLSEIDKDIIFNEENEKKWIKVLENSFINL